ncbi:hypothetical protein EVAR_24891_1 [Eumeta japonica]|uniref:Uncharacterized protein n=1 Tax=Eumeta variegata TaxID=151549 RepID=A0A4C1V6T4_EUMVA|nr:hypothetical protein EVAR_24891_1 [Eumeta japonica]
MKILEILHGTLWELNRVPLIGRPKADTVEDEESYLRSSIPCTADSRTLEEIPQNLSISDERVSLSKHIVESHAKTVKPEYLFKKFTWHEPDPVHVALGVNEPAAAGAGFRRARPATASGPLLHLGPSIISEFSLFRYSPHINIFGFASFMLFMFTTVRVSGRVRARRAPRRSRKGVTAHINCFSIFWSAVSVYEDPVNTGVTTNWVTPGAGLTPHA